MNYRRPIKIKKKKNHLMLQIIRVDKYTFLDFDQIGKDKKILDCNNEQLILNEGTSLPAWIFAAFSIFLLIFLWGDKDGLLILFVPSVVLFLTFLIWAVFKPKQHIIFNRKDGTITYPGFLWSEPVYSKFNDVIATISGGAKTLGLKLWHPNLFTYRSISSPTVNLPAQWSYFVWYMDKNRPLPPGSAFDEYRKKDFERRKSENFPMPLYDSIIETPEDTEWQQTLRNKYWEETVDGDIYRITEKQNYQIKYDDKVRKKLKKSKPMEEDFDISIHTDWEEIYCVNENNKEPFLNTYFRYTMNNGTYVLMKTDAKGNGYQPPEGTYLKIEIITKENITN